MIEVKGLNLSVGDIVKIDTRKHMARYEVVRVRENEFNIDIYELEEIEYL